MTDNNKEQQWLLKEKYHGIPTEEYTKDLIRLTSGEPLDYIIGFTIFLDCYIDLSLQPLIPRTETEFWVEKAIKHIQKNMSNKDISILDIFSGSGCIGVSLLHHIPNAKVDFAEIDQTLSTQIEKNIKKNIQQIDRSHIITSDVFSNISGSYDYIFANPPYIPTKNITIVDSSVKNWEPHKALFAEGDGLTYIKIILDQAPKYLNPEGELYIEFDSQQKEAIEEYVQQTPHYSYVFEKDHYDKWRVLHIIYTL